MIVETVRSLLPAAFGCAGLMYLWLSRRVWLEFREADHNAISYFLFLIGTMILGSAFAFDTDDPALYAIGRVLGFLGAGFVPVALYYLYRDYTIGPPRRWVLVLLGIVPAVSTILAVTNPLHGMLWTVIQTADGTRFTNATEHAWFARVHAPFAYLLFGYSAVALASHLPTLTLAHRRKVKLLLVCAVLPFAVSFANVYLGIGPYEFPFTALTLTLLLPLYWWTSLSLRVYDFSPLAFHTVLDHVRDPIVVLDRNQRVVSANKPAQKLFESNERDLVGRNFFEDLPEAGTLLADALQSHEGEAVRKRGDRYFEVYSAPLKALSGRGIGTVVVCRDVTQRKLALRALADSEHLIRSLVENSSSGILRFARGDHDHKFRCTFANRAAEGFLGNRDGVLVGMPLEKLGLLQPQRLLDWFAGASRDHSSLSYEMQVDIGNEERWLRVVGEPVGRDFSVTLLDITQRKRAEKKILQDALRDPLTGVLNRRGFEKEGAASVRACRTGAVLYLDLDQFKAINDRFGHQAGDALLKAFGHRLEYCLRPEDILARLGGDEFAIILPDVSVDDAKHVATRLVETASEAYILQGQEISCGASVGIALIPVHGDELWQLVSVADRAMYNIKSVVQPDAANDRAAYIEAAIAS